MRLRRRPSPWSSFCACALIEVGWVAIFFTATWLAWVQRAILPPVSFVVLAIFDAIGFVVLAHVVGRFRLTLRDREPTLEIDCDAMCYGESANLWLVEADPAEIDELAVKLVGECWAKSVTDISEFRRTQVDFSRCYEEELLRFSPESDRPLNRKVKMNLPKSAPADQVRWKIIVGARLKAGNVVEHLFPLRVRESIS